MELMPTQHHHHHHVALSARIFLTLSRHTSLLSIAFGRSSRLHPVSAQSCCMYVWPRCPAFAHPCEGVHRSTSLMSSPLLLQQCPSCLVHQILIVIMVDGWWPYSCRFVGCCLQDLFNIDTAFSCNCHQVFSPYIWLASLWCHHIAVSILLLLGRNCASFYREGLTSIRPIAFASCVDVCLSWWDPAP